jgi:hypothetical protein
VRKCIRVQRIGQFALFAAARRVLLFLASASPIALNTFFAIFEKRRQRWTASSGGNRCSEEVLAAEALDSQKRDQDIIKQTTENALDDTVKMLIMRTELWSDDVQEAWARHRGLDKDSDPDPAC